MHKNEEGGGQVKWTLVLRETLIRGVCLRKVVNSRIYGIYDFLGINVIILLIVPIRKPR